MEVVNCPGRFWSPSLPLLVNEEVLAGIGEERVMIHIIRKRQRKWILRGDLLLSTVIKWKMEGGKTGGRPRQMMQDWMMADGYGKLKEAYQQKV